MNIGRGDERVDPGTPGRPESLPGRFDILGQGAGQSRNGCVLDLRGDGPDGLEIAFRGGGEAGFDDVHPEGFEAFGNLELFG